MKAFEKLGIEVDETKVRVDEEWERGSIFIKAIIKIHEILANSIDNEKEDFKAISQLLIVLERLFWEEKVYIWDREEIEVVVSLYEASIHNSMNNIKTIEKFKDKSILNYELENIGHSKEMIRAIKTVWSKREEYERKLIEILVDKKD